MGYPDLGLLGHGEVVERLRPIVEHAGVPVIADADTGYGNALNTRRAVGEFVRPASPRSTWRTRRSRSAAATTTTSPWCRSPR